jgi:CBS domain-containing protein
MLVQHIMTLSPVVVTGDDPIAMAAQYMLDWDVGMLPVVNDQTHKRLVGVITDRDIVVRWLNASDPTFRAVRDVMTPSPITSVYPQTEIHAAMDAMKRARVRRLPIVDTDETVIGVLTLADIARHVGEKDSVSVVRLLQAVSQPAGMPV